MSDMEDNKEVTIPEDCIIMPKEPSEAMIEAATAELAKNNRVSIWSLYKVLVDTYNSESQ